MTRYITRRTHRHIDLMAESLNITAANSVCSPGIKNNDPSTEPEDKAPDVPMDADNNDSDGLKSFVGVGDWSDARNLPELLCAITGDRHIARSNKNIRFNQSPTYHGVRHSSRWFAGKFATHSGWRTAPPNADRFTGMAESIMIARRSTLSFVRHAERVNRYRQNVLRLANAALNNGEKLLCSLDDAEALDRLCVQDGDTPAICAVRTAPVKKGQFKKREGARKVKDFEKAQAHADGSLTPAPATTYRAMSARGNYLSQDRPDVSYSTKELCRDFSVPNNTSYAKLKRLGRYCVGRPRLVYRFAFQERPEYLDAYVDTDFAGCSVTRRSTSGGVAMAGTCCLKHWSKTQSTIALSSGEAELSGIAYGTAQTLGLQSVLRDLGMDLKVRIFSDATAAIGIAKRRGLGRIRHLATADLWIQEKVRSGQIELIKIPGKENPGDVFTKYVDKVTMENALLKMSLHFKDGRSAIAPEIMGRDQATP